MDSDIAIRLSHLAPVAMGSGLLIFAACHDIAARTIPNSTSVLLALVGVLLRMLDSNLINSVLLAALVFAICAGCWIRGWMGGGDVKLLAAAALFVPPGLVGSLLVAISLAGGAVALVYLVARLIARRVSLRVHSRHRGFLARILRAEHWRILRGTPLPYGSAIAAGTLFVIFAG